MCTKSNMDRSVRPVRFGFFSLSLLFFAGMPCLAAPPDSTDCPRNYEDNGLATLGPLKIVEVRGTTAIEVGSVKRAKAPGACVSLFSEQGHRLVAEAKADSDGRFELKDIAPGRYRLVARARMFCTANIPILVVKSTAARTQLLVKFRPTGIDVCSAGELAPYKGDVVKAEPAPIVPELKRRPANPEPQ